MYSHNTHIHVHKIINHISHFTLHRLAITALDNKYIDFPFDYLSDMFMRLR